MNRGHVPAKVVAAAPPHAVHVLPAVLQLLAGLGWYEVCEPAQRLHFIKQLHCCRLLICFCLSQLVSMMMNCRGPSVADAAPAGNDNSVGVASAAGRSQRLHI